MMKLLKVAIGVCSVAFLLCTWMIYRIVRHIFRLADETVWFMIK